MEGATLTPELTALVCPARSVTYVLASPYSTFTPRPRLFEPPSHSKTVLVGSTALQLHLIARVGSPPLYRGSPDTHSQRPSFLSSGVPLVPAFTASHDLDTSLRSFQGSVIYRYRILSLSYSQSQRSATSANISIPVDENCAATSDGCPHTLYHYFYKLAPKSSCVLRYSRYRKLRAHVQLEKAHVKLARNPGGILVRLPTTYRDTA